MKDSAPLIRLLLAAAPSGGEADPVTHTHTHTLYDYLALSFNVLDFKCKKETLVE